MAHYLLVLGPLVTDLLFQCCVQRLHVHARYNWCGRLLLRYATERVRQRFRRGGRRYGGTVRQHVRRNRRHGSWSRALAPQCPRGRCNKLLSSSNVYPRRGDDLYDKIAPILTTIVANCGGDLKCSIASARQSQTRKKASDVDFEGPARLGKV